MSRAKKKESKESPFLRKIPDDAPTGKNKAPGEDAEESETPKKRRSPKPVSGYLRKLGASRAGRERALLERCEKMGVKLKLALPSAARGAELGPGCDQFHIPEVVLNALARVRTKEQAKEVETFLSRLLREVTAISEDNRYAWVREIATADPALFLDFCRPPSPDREALASLFRQASADLQQRMPERAALCEGVVQTVLRRVAGDFKARSPLLVGPPGSGKSYLLQSVASALTEAGWPTEACFVSLAGGQGRNQGEQLEMHLQGTDSRYSNSKPGAIFRTASRQDHRLSLVLLDEADKTAHWELLLQLLDPTMPLQDRYISGSLSHDMRRKVVFLLSANDEAPLRDGGRGPVWSRIEPLRVPDYTPEEKRRILVRQALEAMPEALRPSPEQAEEVAEEIFLGGAGDLCLREAMDLMNRELTSRFIGGPGMELPAPSQGERRIGFGA